MVLIRKSAKNNSPLTDNSKNETEVVERKIFKTWRELLAYLKIETIELPWNVDGASALKILRNHYGKQYRNINDPFLDEVVDAYSTRSSAEQLAALGEAMQEFKLRFCHLNLNPPQYTVFAVESDNTSDYLNKWKEVLTRRQFFRTIDTFSMHNDETLDNPSEDVKIPMSFVQVIGPQDARFGYQYILDKRFFVVSYDVVERFLAQPTPALRIYDLNTWPIQQLDAKLEFDRENIEPFTLTIHASDGTFTYVGDDVNRDSSWKKTIKNDNGDDIPVYDREADLDDDIWHGLKLGNIQDLVIPTIEYAEPLFIVDNKIVYHYDNEDLDNRVPEENVGTRTAIQKRRERRKLRNTLIEFDTSSKSYRSLNLPSSAYIDPDDLILYKNNWIIISDSIFNRDASYVLRLWNPRTHECLRVTKNDMGNHDISRIIPINNGDILLLLNDGRLCRLDVDLTAWLKKDLRLHNVPLDAWQNETKRGYENFPVDNESRFARLRRKTSSDRMLITFEDGKTYDILIKDN